MHGSSQEEMQKFVEKYLKNIQCAVLDVGSMDLNGNYRHFFEGKSYFGLDLCSGPNVDIVSNDVYEYPVEDCSYDVVVSGQVLEHVRDTHRWIKEIARIVDFGGLVFITAPHTWAEHRHPEDCWRIFPDGMKFLLEDIAHLRVLECYSNNTDTVGIAFKGEI